MPTYNHDDLPHKKKKQAPAELANYFYDASVRRQIYLEGLKLSYSNVFAAKADAINGIVTKHLSRQKKQIGALTKAEFLGLMAVIRKDTTKLLVTWRNGFVSDLQSFLTVDVDIAHQIYMDGGETTNKAAENTKAGNALLWASIRNAFVPAAGVSLVVMLTSFINSAMGRVAQALTTAYADSMNNADASTLVKDAVVKVSNSGRGTISTALQQVGSQVQAEVASEIYGEYVWTSVIDSHTTVICLERNMHVYQFGRGPVPPAHYGCRSVIVVVVEGVSHTKQTYYAWLKSQPPEVQDDLLGRKRGRDLRSGELKATDLDRFDGAIEINLKQYSGKAGFILRRNGDDNGAQA